MSDVIGAVMSFLVIAVPCSMAVGALYFRLKKQREAWIQIAEELGLDHISVHLFGGGPRDGVGIISGQYKGHQVHIRIFAKRFGNFRKTYTSIDTYAPAGLL